MTMLACFNAEILFAFVAAVLILVSSPEFLLSLGLVALIIGTVTYGVLAVRRFLKKPRGFDPSEPIVGDVDLEHQDPEERLSTVSPGPGEPVPEEDEPSIIYDPPIDPWDPEKPKKKRKSRSKKTKTKKS